jgi:hypothetical protein
MKKTIATLALCSLGLNAAQINPGAMMCRSYSDMQEIASYANANDISSAANLFYKLEAQGRCAQVAYRMNPDNLGRKDLSGGVTQLSVGGVTTYVLTQEIH